MGEGNGKKQVIRENESCQAKYLVLEHILDQKINLLQDVGDRK